MKEEWLCDPNIRFSFPPNHTSFVLYYPKCVCNCFYCDLSKAFLNTIKFEMNYLLNSLDFIDTLVVSGGEPLLDFNNVIRFQELAKDFNLQFYVYTCGLDYLKIQELLDKYENTYVVIDVKGGSVSEINSTTKTRLGEKLLKTYETFKSHERVIFRLNKYTKHLKENFTNYEIYDIVEF